VSCNSTGSPFSREDARAYRLSAFSSRVPEFLKDGCVHGVRDERRGDLLDGRLSAVIADDVPGETRRIFHRAGANGFRIRRRLGANEFERDWVRVCAA